MQRAQTQTIDRIDVVTGDAGREQAAPLLRSVWPPEVVAELPWRNVVCARPDERLLAFNLAGEIIGHTGIILRIAVWNDRPVKIGGIGGVATRSDSRGRGVASAVMRSAVRRMEIVHDVDFGLLFCESRHARFYELLGWRAFDGDVFVLQPQGRVRYEVMRPFVSDVKVEIRSGMIDLAGLPW